VGHHAHGNSKPSEGASWVSSRPGESNAQTCGFWKGGPPVRRAIKLYQQFLSAQKNPKPDIEKRLKNLQENPKGSNEWDYFCGDYED